MAKIINEIDGWVVIDKPIEMGSTKVVAILKRLLHPKKIGHAGTLDPLATGVLPIAMGKATRTIPFVMDGEKEYEFEVTWGSETATDDLEGDVVDSSEKRPTVDEILEALPSFLGKIEQVPPVYSAIKIDGKRAYDLARAGESVEMKTRVVEIKALELVDASDDVAKFRVKCSKGTYVRSLGRDIGRKLGCLGHISVLRRTACGPFRLDDAKTLDFFEKIEYSDPAFGLIPVETVLGDIPVLAVTEEEARRLIQGQFLKIDRPERLEKAESLYQIKQGNQLIALAKVEGLMVKPYRVFADLFNN